MRSAATVAAPPLRDASGGADMWTKVRGAAAVLLAVAIGPVVVASASPAAAAPAGAPAGGRYLNLRVELLRPRVATASGGSFVLTLVAVPASSAAPGRAAHLAAVDRSLFAPLRRVRGGGARGLPVGPPRGRTVLGSVSWYRWRGCGAPGLGGLAGLGRLAGSGRRGLPPGTRVRVTNLDNGRSVAVRIEDRGPLVPGRLDLCPAAFSVLAPLGRGVARVRVSWRLPRG